MNVVEGDYDALDVIDLRYVFFHVDVPDGGTGMSATTAGGPASNLVDAGLAGTRLQLTFTNGVVGSATVEATAKDNFGQSATSSAGIVVAPVLISCGARHVLNSIFGMSLRMLVS